MIELPVIDVGHGGDESRERFWRSPADLRDDPALRKMDREEFMPGASEAPSGATRRQFLQIMGASMAMAGLAACRRPTEKTLPYTRQPEEIIPGEPLYYATAMPFRGVVHGLLVESHEGRPTKAEGNPQHPMSRGATSPFAQASVLNLYDPDRSDRILSEGRESTWRDFLRFTDRLAVGAETKRIAVLAEPSSSPTLAALRDELRARYPQLQWVTYRPEGDDPEAMGLQMLTGRSVRPLYHFSEADVIVSLDADFLSPTALNFNYNTSQFARSRKITGPSDESSRLYVAESTYSLTGGKADHRMRTRSSDVPAVAAAIAARLGLSGQAGGRFAENPFVQAAADELLQAGQRGLIVVGETQPPEVHALAASINNALGATGTTLSYLDVQEETELPQAQQLADLVDSMRAGGVDALFMLGVNPVYDAPAELDFRQALRSVDQSVHLGMHIDETARASRWHVPRSHYLEAWGDGRAYDGTLSVIQPLIAPLYDSKSDIELVGALARGVDVRGYDLVRETWADHVPGNFEEGWRRILHDGVLPDTQYPTTSIGLGGAGDVQATSSDDGALEVIFRLDQTVLDGSYANNAWMQELPDPTTKLVWDNVAVMSPATAERLGVEPRYHKGQYVTNLIEITLGEQSIQIPAWILPGLADNSIHLSLGYGREILTERERRSARFFDLDSYTDVYAEGPLANGVGVNVAPLRSAALERVALGADVRALDETYVLSTTQEHGSMEGRPLVRYADMETFRNDPEFAETEVPPLAGGEPWEEYPTLWQERHPSDEPAFQGSRYHENRWGMTIDLNTCTGCSACVVACNSENNIQMVGKEEVGRGRQMQWLRVDRYFVSSEEDVHDPKMVVQPVPCMHCENAPCEPVCPVAATVHSPDGINEMVYNRCIGTRYCSNNCPYKVRRFNFFNWSKTIPNTVQMAQNPNVTVRFRGVMEKCTYCVQRVREKQRQANVEDRSIRDGEVQTACQQVCPAEAITFGDLNDPNSAVSREKRNPLNYEMLAEIGVRPRTSYLAQVENPSTRLRAEPALRENGG